MRRAAALAALLAAGTAAPAAAGERLESASYSAPRSAAAAGGQALGVSANYAVLPVIGEEVSSSTAAASATFRLGAGYAQVAHFPGPVTDLAARADASVSSVTLTWSAPGYDGSLGALRPGTTYFIRVASFTAPDTFSDHRLANVTLSTSGTGPGESVAAGATGLLPNTTYWARLWTVDAAGNLSYASNVSTFVTLALPVALQPESFVAVHFTSITAHWVARPASPPDAASMTASGYVLEASSTDFGGAVPGGVTTSSATSAVSLSTLTVYDPGLIVDKIYSLRVAALNWAGVPNWTALGSTDTKFQVNEPLPAVPAFPSVSSFSLTAAWDRNGNPSDSEYHAEVSTASDFSGVVTATDTYNLFYSTGGLLANTSYYFRVFASTRSNNSGWLVFPATATLAPPPEPASGAPFVSVFESSLTVRWLPGDNPLAASSYTVVLTTGGSYPNDFTGNAVLASTAPSGSDPMASLQGLTPNSIYTAFVAALNWSGQPSDFVVVGATATFPATPATPGFEEVSFTSAAVSWSTNGNALGLTTFTVVMSTVASYPPGGDDDASVAVVPGASLAGATVTGLRPNATYHLFVRTEGFAHDSPFVLGGSTATAAVAPALPDGTVFDPVSSSGFTLNWSSGTALDGYDAQGTTYAAQLSLNASFSPAPFSSTTFNLAAAFSGLSPNTSYYARVAAFSHHHGTWTAFSDFGSTATLAAIPAAPFVFNAVHFSSMTIRWAANGNPLTVTTYTVALSTTNSWPNADADTVVLTTAPGGAFPSATPTGLNSGTTYYLFVAALNHRGASTAYASFGSTRTKTSPKTWVGGVDLLWQTAGNWSPAGVPQQTDAVTIAANVTVTADASARISFSSLT
ncbi:MAG: fibronectin type III domain-containing protein, partial [Elusimicrobiota bacterium]|nr:fibronectin type III domain-containing protein [Elusimicrobiota bacterium]